MDRNRILELAVETLEKQKAEINAEIETVRAELKESRSGTAKKAGFAIVPIRRRYSRTPAERRAHSESMKAYWAAKRARAAKTAPVSGKSRLKSAAEKKANNAV